MRRDERDLVVGRSAPDGVDERRVQRVEVGERPSLPSRGRDPR